MLRYYARLSLLSLSRSAGLSVLMLLAIGTGIGVCVATLTVYRAMAGDPIWWKRATLRAVTLTSMEGLPPNLSQDVTRAFTQLAYKDAQYVFRSGFATRKVMMYRVNGAVSGGAAEDRPMRASTRVTTADFFAMFDVPFRYGSGWNAGADERAEPVLVLSRGLNDRLFGGANSVGRSIRWKGREFRIVGVLSDWSPEPKFYDVNEGAFNAVEDVYLPWGTALSLEQMSDGGQICLGAVTSFRDFLNSDCLWLQMWVELPDASSEEHMRTLLDSYWAEQLKAGRFRGKPAEHLFSVPAWLKERQVVNDDQRVLVLVAFAFLAACLMNTMGLLLAKFLNAAPHAGIRRALGARRRDIVIQHLVEVGMLSAMGTVLGLVLTWVALWAVRALHSVGQVNPGGYSELARFNTMSILSAIALAILAALGAGLYPALRVAKLPPARYLKAQ
jgi:putative ABC transport system permease protein